MSGRRRTRIRLATATKESDLVLLVREEERLAREQTLTPGEAGYLYDRLKDLPYPGGAQGYEIMRRVMEKLDRMRRVTERLDGIAEGKP